MKNELKKIAVMLGIVFLFSMLAAAEIWIPWTQWHDDIRIDPCVNGIFFPNGGEAFINHIPMISGECLCHVGYEGPYCEIMIESE